MSGWPPGYDPLPDRPIIRALRTWVDTDDLKKQGEAGRAYCAEVARMTGGPADGVRDLLRVTRRAMDEMRTRLMAMKHHGNYSHGLRPGEEFDLNCLSCRREMQAVS
jgi:hypothetical protein